MDCDTALSIVMSAGELDTTDLAEYREALEHCESCPECSAELRGAERLSHMPRPVAPSGLADRVLATIEKLDEDVAAEVVPIRGRGGARWSGWGLAISAAAAILIGAFVVVGAGLTYVRMNQERTLAFDVGGGGKDVADADDASEPFLAYTEEAPGYVVYDGRVWQAEELATLVPSDLEEQGTVAADLGTGQVAPRTVFATDDAADGIVIRGEEGPIVKFTQVRRLYEGEWFVLVSDRAIQTFGEWPSLPSSIPTPTADDGAPELESAGTDDLDVAVYTRAGEDPSAGFAIAPGTPPDDPAAGNPNWTWWVPAD